MTDKEWDKLMEQKRAEAAKPGYGARCAAEARKANKARKPGVHDQSIQELMLS